MDSTTTAGARGGGGDSGNDEGLLNWVALVVSLVALLGTLLQVLQQYAQSAHGYSNCGERVMGDWHKSKRRRLIISELRFEVLFETPVIFVAPPSNEKRPIQGPLYYINGEPESLKNTRTLLSSDEEKRNSAKESDQVHTADNEKASWVSLLSQLQSMEKQSLDWQREMLQREHPSRFRFGSSFNAHTLAIAVQAKRRSWDTMPSGVKKPYATTAMCHIVEIAAMLGIYWKEFDRSGDRYRAEGNGHILTGSQVADLGLMFTLQLCGESRFRENRVIPVDEVKELCFGFVPTLFSKGSDKRRLHLSPEASSDGSLIQLGSMAEIAETMALIGCNTNTSHIFLAANTNHTHLFPVPFELIGMLGKKQHIKDTVFRVLPNPTPYRWDTKFFSMRRLMTAFRSRLHDSTRNLSAVGQIATLRKLADIVGDALRRNKTDQSYELLDVLHQSIDSCDKYLGTMAMEEENEKLLMIVIREHFQEVLGKLNRSSVDKNAHGAYATTWSREFHKPTPEAMMDDTGRRFDRLRSLCREEKHEEFMDIYFSEVLTNVREAAISTIRARHQSSFPADLASIHQREMALGSDVDADIDEATEDVCWPPGPGRQQNMLETDPEVLGLRSSEIWCTLVFRMLCWLMLHNFHVKDVQVSKGELRGSRLPVYIA